MATPVSLRTRSRQASGSHVTTPDMHRVIQELSLGRRKLSPVSTATFSDDEAVSVPTESKMSDVPVRLRSSLNQKASMEEEDALEFGNHVDEEHRTTRQPCIEDAKSPLTPIYNLVHHMREKLEKQLLGQSLGNHGDESSSLKDMSKTSPGLTKLRNTPVKCVRDRQRLLERKHRQAQGRCELSSVGGGISLWPNMSQMRLTTSEIWCLVAGSISLGVATVALFLWLHGAVWRDLQVYTLRLEAFRRTTELSVHGQEDLDRSVLHWHGTLTAHMNDVDERFGVSLGGSTVTYQVGVLMYCGGIAVLLYYLADNVLAKSNLTPSRIKTWVSLLVVVGIWTFLGAGLLASAQSLETAIEKTVQRLSGHLEDLVYTDLDLTRYHNVLLYWRTRCLPPTTSGTLSILGLVQVRDMSYYLQYYSLPVITALLTPVIKLIASLRTIYSTARPPT